MEWHELPKYNGIQVSQLIYTVTCLLIVTSTKFWCDVVWHDVETSRHTVSILPFLELIVKNVLEIVVVNFM